MSSSLIACIGYHDLGLDRIGTLKINDTHLKIKQVATGFHLPTHISFLGLNDILVLEKNNGTVRRIVNGNLIPQPLLDVNVAKNGEQGMLGIAVSRNFTHTNVFLYYTETESKDGGKILGDRLYRYELVDDKLVNPKLLLDLPAEPGPYLYGGTLDIGPDGFVYVTVGDMNGSCQEEYINGKCVHMETVAQNYANGTNPDGRAGILRVSQEAKNVHDIGTLVNSSTLDKYYAYGIRNSFGIDFDPVSGVLWDTENGPNYGNEINIVKPGFNSGWIIVQGIWKEKGSERGELLLNPKGLVDFGGKGKYSEPEFVWNQTVGVTAIKFLDSDKYGESYKDDMFVADSNNGRIYHFELNENRSGLLLQGPLIDRIADDDKELNDVVFAQGFGLITDLQIGPDGYLYVVTFGSGKIFKIVPESDT